MDGYQIQLACEQHWATTGKANIKKYGYLTMSHFIELQQREKKKNENQASGFHLSSAGCFDSLHALSVEISVVFVVFPAQGKINPHL